MLVVLLGSCVSLYCGVPDQLLKPYRRDDRRAVDLSLHLHNQYCKTEPRFAKPTTALSSVVSEYSRCKLLPFCRSPQRKFGSVVSEVQDLASHSVLSDFQCWLNVKEKAHAPLPLEGEKFPVIALVYQHRRSASALFLWLLASAKSWAKRCQGHTFVRFSYTSKHCVSPCVRGSQKSKNRKHPPHPPLPCGCGAVVGLCLFLMLLTFFGF